MTSRLTIAAVVAAVGFMAAAPIGAAPPDAKAAAGPADIFGLGKVWKFHLAVSARDYEALQPAAGGGFFGGPGGPGGPGFPGRPAPPPKAADKPTDVHKGGSFGIEFPFVHADFTAEGKTYKDIGLRYKGGGSFVMSNGRTKRNFKVELDHFDTKQRFHGHKKINLNAGVMDPTGAREALAFAVFRDAGVLAPRTAFAEVTLTVPGKFDGELVGLYTVIEQVDKSFLAARFKNGKGLLMKPEVRPGLGPRGPLGYQGDNWEPYKAALQPKRDATPEEAKRVIEFTRLINRADDPQFRREIGSYLDVDQFLRFLGVTALLVNMDSFFTGGHNAYVYLNPDTNKFVFIPWDLDLSFGGFFMFGQADQQADMSLTHPYPGENRLVERVLAVKEHNDRYQAILKELSSTCFAKDRLLANLDAIEKATKDARDREAKAVTARRENMGFGFGAGPGPGFGAGPGQTSLRSFIDRRTAAVADQVAGKSKGRAPQGFGFGPPPGGGPGPFGGGPPRPGEVLPPPLQDALRLTPEQRKQLAELQKDVDDRIDKLLTDEQKAQLRRMRAGGPPGGSGKERPKGDRP